MKLLGLAAEPMRIYGWDAKGLSVVDGGACTLEGAVKTLGRCYEKGLLKYETGEAAMSATSFGLLRSKVDYIDISCTGPNFVLISFDRLIYSSLWSRLWTSKRRFEIKGDRELAEKVIGDYFELERGVFEDTYASFLHR